jgi:DNA-binding NarL/FixJ family response regulator
VNKTKVIIADDHPLIVKGLSAELAGHSDLEIVAIAQDGERALEIIRLYHADIALLDLQMPGLHGLQVAEYIQSHAIPCKVIILTMFREISLFEKAKTFGVTGYLLKDNMLEEIHECLHAVMSNETYLSKAMQTLFDQSISDNRDLEKLTRMERKVLRLIQESKTTHDIAELLFLSEKTIENHRYNISKKLGLPGEKNALLRYAMGMRKE